MRDISHLNGVRSGQTKACQACPIYATKDAVAHSKCQSRSECWRQREAHERKVSRDTKKSAPSQACICQTTRSVFSEQVTQVGNSWGKALAHPSCRFHG